jgi:hypothetical protein
MSRTLLKSAGALIAASFAFAGAANAATNLVDNGSFENGLADWTIGGTWEAPYAPAAIFYNSASGYPTGAFGEAVPPNNAPTNSPDAVGERAAYFVADLANNQSLSQTVTITTDGIYQIGFSAYAPANGYANFYNATFSGLVAKVLLPTTAVSAGPVTTWQTFASATNLTAGDYLVEFVFNSFGVPAKDVVIDQVYIIEGNPPTNVPEPGTYALLLAGLGMLGVIARRRMR